MGPPGTGLGGGHDEHEQTLDQILAEEQAVTVIKAHRPALERLIAALEELETLQHDQIEQCLGPAERKKNIEVVPH
jgi:ATP-dependent Zn protease